VCSMLCSCEIGPTCDSFCVPNPSLLKNKMNLCGTNSKKKKSGDGQLETD
jgi:hypothetical protein